MFSFLLILHIFISFLLVVVILLQSGKGGGLASAFGGSGTGDATFGGRQAVTFLGKATTVLGTIFFLSSFGLALLSSYQAGPRSAVQQELQTSPMPVAPTPVAQPAGGDIFEGGQSQEAGSETQAQPQNQ